MAFERLCLCTRVRGFAHLNCRQPRQVLFLALQARNSCACDATAGGSSPTVGRHLAPQAPLSVGSCERIVFVRAAQHHRCRNVLVGVAEGSTPLKPGFPPLAGAAPLPLLHKPLVEVL